VEIRRSAAENQESRGERPAVGQHPQQREEVRPALDFINDHQPFERAQGRLRLAQSGEALRVLQVEVVERVRRHQTAGQRGLAALARAQQRHHAAAFQSGTHECDIGFAVDHHRVIHHEYPSINVGISWCLLLIKHALRGGFLVLVDLVGPGTGRRHRHQRGVNDANETGLRFPRSWLVRRFRRGEHRLQLGVELAHGRVEFDAGLDQRVEYAETAGEAL